MRLLAAMAAGAVLIGSAAAIAAGAAETPVQPKASETLFLMQVIALLVVGRTIGEIMLRLGQPAIMGQLVAGILLGPSALGAIWPEGQAMLFPPNLDQKSMLDGVSQLGILLLLLMTGMETDLGLVRKVRRAAISVSVAGIAVPFACGYALGEYLPDSMLPKPELRLITSLFLGTALSISSVKIVAMVVREMDFLRRDVGQVIVASAVIDDTIGWVIIAITFSLALHGSVDLWAVGQTLLGTAVFLVASFTLGRRAVFLLIRWANDELLSEAAVITTILIVMGCLALATHAIGVHTVLGAFVAGILVGQSPILTRHIDEQLRGLITALFAPIFFGLAGLSTDLTILRDPSLVLLTLGLIAIASIGKFSGAFLGGTIGGMRPAESFALACGMNARGSTEVIVATIGLSIGALNENLFTMIVAMAVLTTLAMPPMLRWALGRLPLEDTERARLDREAFEERGFVPRMERLLVAADVTAKGRFAARLAGLLAGSRGMPVTVVKLVDLPEKSEEDRDEAAGLGALVEAGAGQAREQESEEHTAALPAIEVTERQPEGAAGEAVAKEAAKGFDFLLVGIEPTSGPTGGFHREVAHVVAGFEGPFAVVAARSEHATNPDGAPLSILLPVNGSDVARRGAEVAFTLARATGAPVTALFVTNPADVASRPRLTRSRASGEAVLKEITMLADKFDVALKTATRANIAAEDAILRQARLSRHNLIVMGVSRRPGEALDLGNVADAVLEASERSVVFVVS